jgi:hypothetical protein
MFKIPQKFITKGVEATEVAKKAVAKIENAVKQEVITPNKLVREPDSDLFEKASYMTKDEFWNDYSNRLMDIANKRRLGEPYDDLIPRRVGPRDSESLKFSRKTGRVSKHITNDLNKRIVTKFAEDGRTPISEITTGIFDETVKNFKTGITKNYSFENGRKILESTSEQLPNGGVRYTHYVNDRPYAVTVTDASGNDCKQIWINSDGTISRYIKNGEKLI